jgi:hypothetical protein
LNWVEESTGPSSEAIWTVYCKSKHLSFLVMASVHDSSVAGEVKGVGVGPQKAAAKQAAAKQALAVRQCPDFVQQSLSFLQRSWEWSENQEIYIARNQSPIQHHRTL